LEKIKFIIVINQTTNKIKKTNNMEELNPQQSISAAFDSVNLINNTILEIVNDNNKSTVTRNVQHLEIMLSKEWFLEALTQQQLTDINSCIANGNSYTA
jgi:hypothetical protein